MTASTIKSQNPVLDKKDTSGTNASKYRKLTIDSLCNADVVPENGADANSTDTDVENDEKIITNPLCEAVAGCGLKECNNHRKVVSHIFGRNKKCTQQFPESSMILWCRKHYQRTRYRFILEGKWHWKQLELVRVQLQKFQDLGTVSSWKVALRKKEQEDLHAENLRAAFALRDNDPSPCWERFLVPYLGSGKTFEDVNAVLDAIDAEFMTPEYEARENEEKVFPGIELLASFTEDNAKKHAAKIKVHTLTPVLNGKALTRKTIIKPAPRSSNSTPSTYKPPENSKTFATSTNGTTAALPLRKRKSDVLIKDTTDVSAETPTIPSKRRHLVRGMDLDSEESPLRLVRGMDMVKLTAKAPMEAKD